jgi:hypothetical protein
MKEPVMSGKNVFAICFNEYRRISRIYKEHSQIPKKRKHTEKYGKDLNKLLTKEKINLISYQ